jgi:hypothetical protein
MSTELNPKEYIVGAKVDTSGGGCANEVTFLIAKVD